MQQIDVDFEVFKHLTMRRETEQVSYNDVLRNLLGLNPTKSLPAPKSPGAPVGNWTVKGVTFPAGTEFRSDYKGRLITGVVDGGALLLNGTKYDSPSAAAMAVTDSAVNGWVFWECRMPGQSAWRLIKSLRQK
ncbi:MAG: DUF2924 domain-containing protein [Burkholderiales bacterium]|nr:DUF2924 domain-containing protein [Burkholderiales bacterium]